MFRVLLSPAGLLPNQGSRQSAMLKLPFKDGHSAVGTFDCVSQKKSALRLRSEVKLKLGKY